MGTEEIRRIAIYGRSGVGKTTISANLSGALARAGYRVLLVGCGNPADFTGFARGVGAVPTLLELLKGRSTVSLEKAVWEDNAGYFRLETGTPAGSNPDASILSAVQRINESGIFERMKLDHVIYNVQGDEAGGGFTVPIRKGLFRDVFTVMSAELKSVRAANTLFDLIRQHSGGDGGVRAGGIIANFMEASYSRELVDEFAEKTGTIVLAYLPRSFRLASRAYQEKALFEDSLPAEAFDSLALKIARHSGSRFPYPLPPDDIWRFSMKWNTRFLEMETAEGAGAGI